MGKRTLQLGREGPGEEVELTFRDRERVHRAIQGEGGVCVCELFGRFWEIVSTREGDICSC